MRSRFILMSALLLAACTSTPEPAPPPPPPVPVEPVPLPPPPPPPPAAGGGAAQQPAIVAVTREFLPRTSALSTTYSTTLPTAYLLLSSSQRNPARRLCQAWFELPTSAEVADVNPVAQFAKTFWLLGNNSNPNDNCNRLVERYDYAKANTLRSAFGFPQGTLLAVRFPDNRTFYLDLTAASKEQSKSALLSWYEVASTTDEAGQTLESRSIAARMKRAICKRERGGLLGSIILSATAALGPLGFVVGAGREEMCGTQLG